MLPIFFHRSVEHSALYFNCTLILFTNSNFVLPLHIQILTHRHSERLIWIRYQFVQANQCCNAVTFCEIHFLVYDIKWLQVNFNTPSKYMYSTLINNIYLILTIFERRKKFSFLRVWLKSKDYPLVARGECLD